MTMTYYVRGIPFLLRIILFALVELIGIIVQIIIPGGFFPGIIIMAAGWILLWAKNYDNRPKDQGFEDWKPASVNEVERIRSNINRSKQTKLPVYFNPTARNAAVFIFLGALIVSFFIAASAGFNRLFIIILDAFIVAVPLLFSGLVKLWVPAELSMKMDTFTSILDISLPKDLKLTPYIRFDKDKEGRKIPEDLRFLLEKSRMPEDLVGAQFQIAVNNGPNGKVPYMYAVFICRGKGPSFQRISQDDFNRFIKETGGDDEYGTIVIRQPTENGGYHTDDKDCKRLYRTVATSLSEF
jgi:hypothetical protein